MAFAQLVFPIAAQAGQVMKAIAKVMLGEKDIANLEGVLTTPVIDPKGMGIGSYVSEIKNPDSEAWTLAYPVGIPSTGNFALNTFTISSPCLTASKSKFVRFMIASSAGLFTEPINAGSTLYTSTTNYSIHAQGAKSIDAAGTPTSPSWRNNNGSQSIIRKFTGTTQLFVVWISWSARHLFVTSSVNSALASDDGTRQCYFGAFEFDENGLTQYSNSAPVAYISGIAGTAPSNLTASTTTTGTSVNVLGMFDPATSTITAVRALFQDSGSNLTLDSATDMGIGQFSPTSIQAQTYFSGATKKWLPISLFINDTDHGGGMIDLTKYSNIFLFSNIGFENGVWTSATGTVYKSINLHNASSVLTSTLLVKYG